VAWPRDRSRSYDVARALLDAHRMMKTLISSAVVVTLLCGPALAQPAPLQQPRVPLKLQLAVTDGTDKRTYELVMLDESCGSVEERSGDRADEVKLCARDTTAQGARLSVQWKLHTKVLDHAINYEAIIAKGKTVEIGRTNGARFTLTLI